MGGVREKDRLSDPIFYQSVILHTCKFTAHFTTNHAEPNCCINLAGTSLPGSGPRGWTVFIAASPSSLAGCNP
jgi:hypothetical protein